MKTSYFLTLLFGGIFPAVVVLVSPSLVLVAKAASPRSLAARLR